METISSKNEYPLKKISQFVFDQEHSIYTHPDNITIEYQDGGEAYILESLKKVKDLSSHSQEFRQYIKDWPSRYHFSNKRINFLEGIKEILPKNANVLEIGSGCGTITRWLGEHFRSVDALEGNTQRAGITRYRTKNLDNVKVYCGNLLATSFDKKYDIITLIGSLEYLPFYDTEYNNPKEACSALLTRLKDALNKNGILVIAIENKFGAKYFSGCKEDHTGKEFEGIIGYPEKTPVTFSRNEIESIIINSGFNYNQFYHVFPDYKLTETIIPENSETLSLYPQNWIRTPFEDYSGYRLNLFPDSLFLKSVTDSGLIWQFSNSFVIVATKSKNIKLSVDWFIKKYSNNDYSRSDFYHEITLIKKNSSLSLDKKYFVQRSSLSDFSPLKDTEKFVYELNDNDFFFGRLLSYDFFTAVFKKSPEHNLKQILKKLHNELLLTYSLGINDPEEYPLVNGEAIDYTFWNIIVSSQNKLNFIDKKWRSKDPLPVDFVLFRNLLNIFDKMSPYLKNKNKKLFIIETIQEIYPHYSEKRLTENLQFERRFQSFVSGREQNFTIDSFVQYCFNEQVQQNQVMTVQVTNLNQTLESRDQQVLELSNQVTNLNQEITRLYKQYYILKEENNSMKSSISYRLLTKFHMIFIEPLFPQNSKHREIYDLGLKSGRILINDGMGKLYWHYNERRRVKKNERRLKKSANAEKAQYTVNNCSHSTSDQVKFPKSREETEVSIIIPVFNKFQYTLNCLKSISDNTTGSFEVVIVDDASTDGTANQLKNIPNLTIIRNKENLGFVESCNNGAKLSKGKFLLFLNNDTVVTENWLPPLLELIKKEDVGGVGAKLIYPNGTLQEAGGIIWNDASGWNYGRGDHPEKSQYNYVRDVDYCSGAALLVKRDLFEELGGFDSQFKPGYYEDTDLCFSIRERGYRVLYQPLSVIIHFEGISNGTDLSTGIKKYQGINRSKFLKKWENRLAERHYAANSNNVFDARIRRKGKKILVIDHYVPTWDRDSGSYRMYNLLKLLVALNHKVTFIGDNLFKFEPYTADLQQNGIEVIYNPTVQSIDEYLKDYGNFFDIVILSRSHIAIKHYHNVKKNCTHAKIIFDTVDLQYLRERRRAEIENDATVLKEAENSKVTELFLATHCDMTLVVSPIEKEFLLQEDPQLRIEVLSNIHEVTPCTTPFCDRKDLMFVGGFNHLPNVDAMKWFTKEIFPHITKSIPDIKLYIIGSDPTKEIERLASSNIIVVGYAKDLTPYFNNCRVFVSPLRYGAGVKGKINQSMSFGLPVISTSIGAEGMGLIEGKNIILADTAEVFARICVDIYYNEKLWNELSKNSITNVQEKFSATVWKPKISSLLDSFFIDEIAYKMKKEWNARGKANYKYFISYSNSEEEFIHSGKESLEKLILPIMDSITHNRDPNELKVLEIGCGAGRVTFWMASVFGEVYGVDIAEDMIEKGKKYCKNLKNVHLSTNNGMDLSDFGNDFFDFVFSFIVFQHIPDKNIIINYIKEVERVLKHGSIFKFQLQGYLGKDYADKEKDSWYGVSFSEDEIKEIAEKFNFEIISLEGQGTQYFWIIFKKR